MPVGDQIRPLRQPAERGGVDRPAGADQLTVGAVDLPAADRQPTRPGGVDLSDRVEAPAGEDMIPHDRHIAFHPALTGRPVGGEDIDHESVMLGERGRFRMQRHRRPRCDMPAHHRLRPVIDDAGRYPTEVGERAAVAVEERAQIQAGGETAEAVPREGQRHVEGVHRRHPDVGEQAALLTPVDLPLRTRGHHEPAVQPGQPTAGHAEFRFDPRPHLRDVHLHPLVVPVEAVLGDQPLVDHARLQRHVAAQPRLHHPSQRFDLPRLGSRPGRRRRRAPRRFLREVLLHRLPVMPGHPGDLRDTHTRRAQRAETTQVHPFLRIEDHRGGSPFGLVY